ncbi:MAG: hypothetical protein R3F19_00320 [Verrucomicrobiales bacterium]
MQSVSSTLSALARKAKEPEASLQVTPYRLIDLPSALRELRQSKTESRAGVDGVTVSDYESLDEPAFVTPVTTDREALPGAERQTSLHSQSREQEIAPTGNSITGKQVVQHAASRILESIFEQDFSDRSIGYRKESQGTRVRAPAHS